MKPIDKELAEFLELQSKVKLLTERMEEIKLLCKNLGSFSTEKYLCMVLNQERQSLAGIEEFKKHYKIETLFEKGLVKVSNFKIVKIKELFSH